MKYAFFLLAGLSLSVLTHAQSKNGNSAPGKDTLKVTLLKDGMFVTYRNLPVSINSIQALDSLMKKIPALEHLNVEFESRNAEQQEIRSIDSVLSQCHCPMKKTSIRFRE